MLNFNEHLVSYENIWNTLSIKVWDTWMIYVHTVPERLRDKQVDHLWQVKKCHWNALKMLEEAA